MFKKPNFYVYFAIFCIFFYFLLTDKTFSFGWLWVWTEHQNIKLSEWYVRQDLVDDTAVHTVMANLSLWKWQYTRYHYLLEWTSAIAFTKALVETDESQKLESQANKKIVLESYISQMRSAVNENQEITEYLRSKMTQKKSESEYCKGQKNVWDTLFFDWLEQQQKVVLQDWLATSLEYSPCYIENRVYASAYQAVHEKLYFYNDILKQKLNIIENNSHLIIQNFELFKNNQLERLISLRNELESFKIN